MIKSKVSGLPTVNEVLAVLLAPALLLALAAPASAADWTDSVRTHSGLVSGEGLEDGIRVFRGIPFAAPPVGDLRWRPPQDVAPWDQTRNSNHDQLLRSRSFELARCMPLESPMPAWSRCAENLVFRRIRSFIGEKAQTFRCWIAICRRQSRARGDTT